MLLQDTELAFELRGKNVQMLGQVDPPISFDLHPFHSQ